MSDDVTAGRYEHLSRALREPERVIELKLSSPIATLPAEVLSLPNLEVLILAGTRIDELPEALAAMPKLRTLELVDNRFRGVPSVLARMPWLHTLRFLGRSITSLSGLGSLRTLRSLEVNCDDCALPDELFTLVDLEALSLGGRRVSELPAALANLSALVSLHLRAGGYADLPPWLANMPKLQTLGLQAGAITGLPQVVAEMPAIRSLSMDHVRGSSSGFDALSRTRLERLSLTNVQCTLPDDPGNLAETLVALTLKSCGLVTTPRMLTGLRRLETLSLARNALVDESAPGHAEFDALRDVDLSHNRLTDLPAWLGSARHLRTLRIDHNPIASLRGATLSSLSELELLSVSTVNATLSSLPDEMARMPSLRSLEVAGFGALTALPTDLSGLRSLESLVVARNRLAALPDSLGSLAKLESLDVSGNALTSLPASLGQLASLRRLVLSGNRGIRRIDDAMLARLTQLRSFVFETGALEAIPEALFTLADLDELVLLDCAATILGPFPRALANLTRLRTLRLGSFVSELPYHVSSLESLEVFQWRNPRLSKLPDTLFRIESLREIHINGHLFAPNSKLGPIPESIGALTRLEVLHMPNIGITELPDSIGECTALRTIVLDANPIGTVPESIGALRDLDVLSLKKCGLKSVPESLGACAALRCLWLDENPLETLPASFAGLTGLANLGLANCKLTALPAGVLALRDLSTLGLTGNTFDAAASKDLEAFTKQQRGSVSVDQPRKAPSKKALPKASPTRLSPKVIAQIERLGGRFIDRPAPDKPAKLALGGRTRELPEAIRQLLKDVSWREVKDVEFDMPDRKLGVVRLFGVSDLSEEYECMKNHAYIDFGYTVRNDMLLLDLDGNADPSDPDVHYLMEGDYWETKALKTRMTLSQFLATGRRTTP